MATNHLCTAPGCTRPTCAKGLCRPHYSKAWELAHGNPAVAGKGRGYRGPLAARFWPKVNKDGPTMPGMESPCWVWTGATHKDGYGVISHERKHALAHRVSLLLDGRELPADAVTRHRCDHRPCVRPTHLLTGTQPENVADMDTRGRRVPATGEQNGRSKLTMADVVAARSEHAAGQSVAALGMKYGVSTSTMGYAVRGQSWRGC